MPQWLQILIVMEFMVIVINPVGKDFIWFQSLRRPKWFWFHIWIPLIWLAITICFYASALFSWNAISNWRVILAYVVLVALVQGYAWLICRLRRIFAGIVVTAMGWALALAIALGQIQTAPLASLLLLPYLFWSPVEAVATMQMIRLNTRLKH